MRHLLFIVLSLLLSLAACAPPVAPPLPVIAATATSTVSPTSTFTVTRPAASTETVTPTPSQTAAPAEPPTQTFTATNEPALPTSTPTSTLTATCAESSALDISTSPESPKVGDTVKVTFTLRNTGCLALGLPQYRLYIESDQAVLSPASPEPVVHYLAVSAGESDSVVFELQAVASGEASLSGTASYEVHIGYPGPAYWGSAATGDPLVITVAP